MPSPTRYDESQSVAPAALAAAAAAGAHGGVPGTGFLAMRSAHAYSEAVRLHLPAGAVHTASASVAAAAAGPGPGGAAQLVVVVGQAGSGVGIIAGQVRVGPPGHAPAAPVSLISRHTNPFSSPCRCALALLEQAPGRHSSPAPLTLVFIVCIGGRSAHAWKRPLAASSRRSTLTSRRPRR